MKTLRMILLVAVGFVGGVQAMEPASSGAGKCMTLHEAVAEGHLGVVVAFVEGGADVNAKDDRDRTPLYMAVGCGGGRLIVVKFLVENGADVNARTRSLCTPLHEAAAYGYLHIVEFLVLKKGASINAKNVNKNTPLHVAAKMDRLEVVRLLVKEGADVHIEDACHSRPLFSAACCGCLEVARFLLWLEADPENLEENVYKYLNRRKDGRGDALREWYEKKKDVCGPWNKWRLDVWFTEEERMRRKLKRLGYLCGERYGVTMEDGVVGRGMGHGR